MKSFKILPKHVIQLLARLGIVLILMTITRIIFYIANSASFNGVSFTDFIAGIWMDCISIGIWFIPFYGLSLLPLPFVRHKFYKILLKLVFVITSIIMIGLNLLDVEYYKYTAKRSTADLFTIVTAGNDINQLLGTFITDFWWLILLFILAIVAFLWMYNKTNKITGEDDQFNYLNRTIHFFLFSALLFIMGRGGFGYRPADMLTASQLTRPENTALVLNTPLSIIKTIGKASLQEVKFFESESKYIYNPVNDLDNSFKKEKAPNVMVIILESFGNEWLGKKTGGPYTPFLDSILDESLYFSNAWANGKKSIEAVPAIFASIPSLLDNPYISSHYGTNSINALPKLLKEKGYETAFYHGATNGSMKFDVFAAHAGFDHYFGRTEYNNEDHTDATWGVLDEYFMPWTARSMTQELKEPFMTGMFTLSSHHPYFVPKEHRSILPDGPHPMAKSTAYGDMSLRLFFEEAQKQPWYNNTVFILCADHTPAGTSERYWQRIGMYQIPIAIFDPRNKIEAKNEDQLFNQIDIAPTVLDIIGYDEPFYAFGNSYFESVKTPFAINYISNTYHYVEGSYMLNFVDDESTGLYNYKIDTLMQYDSLKYYPSLVQEMENRLKGIIQRYNHDLINNDMRVK
tara:strand:+ start:153154 stop:155043 length:1890 start_codon:yes stop_codon:yes gene_type:complete